MGIFSKFKSGFQRGTAVLQGAFERVSGRPTLSEEDLVEIEEAFYACDFGPSTTEEVLEEVKISFRDENKGGDGGLINIARTVLSRILSGSEGNLESLHNTNPQVICLVGVNGAGKTTTCAKLGYQLSSSGSSVMIGACDTFRAAATEQLKDWASRLNLDVVSGHHGSDAAAVAFDSYSSALAKKTDYLLLDTAGRLHVKDHLMDELSKLKRVLQKREPCAPQHSWLVVDGSTEQMACFRQRHSTKSLD